MNSSKPQLFVLVEDSDAFVTLCGISLLERLLRVVQRIGFREATIIAKSVDSIRTQLGENSWARAELFLKFREQNRESTDVGEILCDLPDLNAAESNRALVIVAGYYFDERLLRELAGTKTSAILVDSGPPKSCIELWEKVERRAYGWFCGAALLDREWLSKRDPDMLLVGAVLSGAEAGQIELVDAARQPSYVADLRKHLRPVCFPAPSLGQLRLAEKIVEDAAQNGVLDIPALVHAPIETWLVSHLWKTSIKPNQITFVTLLLGLGATCFYATGSLWFGTVLALVVGIFDGLDGKLARTKVETTELGRWEHTLDYVIEFSWWAALAHHFYLDGHSPNPYLMLILLFGSDLVDRVAKRSVKRRLGRSLDDVAPFDRLVRAIGGRRNIYIWIFAIGLTFGAEATAFTTICCWGAGTAVVHLIRAAQIRLEGRDEPLGRPR